MPEIDLQAIKEEVRARTDIVALIGQHTTLKRSGKNYTGLCPFHADRKPSFSVSPVTQSYRCWSCGEKGDSFTFVQKTRNLDFIQALEALAREAGVPFERRGLSPEHVSEREQMLELNRLAVRFFQESLSRSQDARDLLAQRGLLKTTQEQWDLGYAPPDWEALLRRLQQRGANLDLAAKAGLIKARKEEGSGYYDTFRHRLIFPIHDTNGQVIAFGGRAIDPSERAKYLNSEQSPLFDKSRTLYGLYFARKRLSGDTPPVFVEGYVDVITAHQAGFTQCVATLGTSMTEPHARMLARISPRVIICYDSDRAGINATLRGAVVWEEMGIENAEVRVARLPAGEDPDSLLRRGEMVAFQKALDTAVPRVDFQIELAMQRYDLDTVEGRDAALAECVAVLATIPRLSVRARYADQLVRLHPLYGRFGLERALDQILAEADAAAKQLKGARSPRMQGYPLTEEANGAPLHEQPPGSYRPPSGQKWGESWPHTREVVRRGDNGEQGGRNDWQGRKARRDGPVGDPTPPSLAAPTLTGAEKAERQLLRALFSAEWRLRLLGQLKPETMVTPHGRRLLRWVARTTAREDGSVDPIPLLHQAQAEEEAGLPGDADASFVVNDAIPGQIRAKFSDFVGELLEESPFMASNDLVNEAALRDCIRRLEMFHADRERHELTQRLQQANSPEEQRALLEQYHQKMRAMRGSPAAQADRPAG